MDSARWSRLSRLFEEAVGLPPEEREAFLEAECEDDEERAEVERLIALDASAEDFFDRFSEDLQDTPLPAEWERTAGAEALVGHTAGPYRLVEVLGEGGMGIVYRAERETDDFDQTVAVKVVSDVKARTLARFRAERAILARLDHPGIARLLSGGTLDDGRLYVVMEYVDGQPITAYADDRRLSVDERLDLFEQVCEAVQAAHRALVVHRDLKPSNVLVTEDADGAPRVKLLDFGIAKLLAPSDKAAGPVTRTGQWLLTPEYAAPEQVKGEAVSTATDVYALGVLLYELLTGHRPYRLSSRLRRVVEHAILEREPTHLSTVVEQHAERRLPDGSMETVPPTAVAAARSTDLRRLQRRLSGDLDRITQMALRKEPERRYGSADGLRADVVRHREGLPVEAESGSAAYRASRFVKRHRWGLAAVGAVMMALAVGLGLALWQARVAQAERDRARVEAATAAQVSGFLEDLFREAGPSTNRGDTLTVYDLLEMGTQRIDSLGGQSQVQARLLSVLGLTYRDLADNERADTLLRRALEIQREVLGEDASDTQETRHRLLTLMLNMGREDEADRYAVEALASARRAYGETHEATARALADQAVVMQKVHQDYAQAESLAQAAVAVYDRLPPSSFVDSSRAAVEYGLGTMLLEQGEPERAAPWLRSALRLMRGRDSTSTDYLMGSHALAVLYRQLERYDEAIAIHEEMVGTHSRVYGPDHPFTGQVTLGLGSTLRAAGRSAEAVGALEDAIRIGELRSGARSGLAAEARLWLGRALQDLGRTAEAEEAFESAYRYYAGRPSGDAWQRSACRGLVGLYEEAGRAGDAARYRTCAETT